MVSYKRILDLHCSGRNITQVSTETGYDRVTIRSTLAKAEERGLLPTAWKDMSEDKLRKLLRKKQEPRLGYLEIDLEWVHRELSDPHVTVNLLHEECQQKAASEGLKAYSRTQFFTQYHAFCTTVKYSAKTKAKPGSSVELDFAGDLVHYTDPLLHTKVNAVLFVATLTFSKLTYVEAIERQSAVCFAHATMNALDWFGGTCRFLRPDNTRAAVILHSKHEVAQLNELFRELAEHYRTSVVPAPVYTPTAKPNVEDNVYNSYSRILAPLRHCTFYSLGQLNEALWSQCEAFNNEPFQKNKDWSRRTLFEAEERRMLSQLPPTKFEVRMKATATVRDNCHALCRLDGYYYSVPWQVGIGRVVFRLGANDVRIYSEFGQFIYCHKRGSNRYDRYVTEPSHLPSHIRQYVYASPGLFRERAASAGNAVLSVIDRLFCIAEEQGKVPEVEYETANGILGLSRPTKKHQGRCVRNLEEACSRLLLLHPNPCVRIGYQAVKHAVEDVIEEQMAAQTKEFMAKNLGEGSLMELLGGER
ncbi:MAG: IS21 family transposase [Sphaerochaeta sp.]|nr:IS21 family transposase [Sphaerochaeta sp.]